MILNNKDIVMDKPPSIKMHYQRESMQISEYAKPKQVYSLPLAKGNIYVDA